MLLLLLLLLSLFCNYCCCYCSTKTILNVNCYCSPRENASEEKPIFTLINACLLIIQGEVGGPKKRE